MLLRPFWSSSPEPPRSTVTSASPSLRGRQGFPTSYVYIEESASRRVKHGKRGGIPRIPTKYESRTRHRQPL